MMFFVPFLRLILLAQLLGAQLIATNAAAPATQPVQSTSVSAAPQSDGLLDAFGRSKLGQYAQGKRAVTWKSLQEMREPGFWIDSIKDLVLALLMLIPRILIAALFLLIFYF